MTLTSSYVCFINIPIDTLSVTSVYVCSYHLYKSLLGKLFNAHYSILVITQHCIYTNLQLGYYIVPLLCVGCVWQPPINEHDDNDDDDIELHPGPYGIRAGPWWVTLMTHHASYAYRVKWRHSYLWSIRSPFCGYKFCLICRVKGQGFVILFKRN